MSNPMIRIHNVETDEVIDREMTNEEADVYLAESAAAQEALTNAALRAEQKAGLLERLGITAEEAELLLS